MSNIHSFRSSALLCHDNASSNYSPDKTSFAVVITHRGKDTKESLASLVYHNLQNNGFNVFFDKKSIEVGENIAAPTKYAIRKASVHVVIFSPNYAQSKWCLDNLHFILKSGAPMVPVFCEVKPCDVRMEDEDGVYAKAFQMHKKDGKFKNRELEKWKAALHVVSVIKGYIFKWDQGEMLEKVATSVANYIDMAKSQPNRS